MTHKETLTNIYLLRKQPLLPLNWGRPGSSGLLLMGVKINVGKYKMGAVPGEGSSPLLLAVAVPTTTTKKRWIGH